MPKILVFDIGNVLIRWDPDQLYAKLIPDPLARQAFFHEVLPPEWNLEQDRGRPWAEAEAERIALFPQQADLIRAWRARWHEMVPEAITQNVAVLRAAQQAGIPCYAITNFAADTFAEAQERFSFLKTGFQGIVVSAQEQLLKPDPRIFRRFLERFSLQAEDCLFIDDSAANVRSAASLGFSTIWVAPKTDLLSEIRKHGFVV